MTETNPVRGAKVVAVDFGNKAMSIETEPDNSDSDPQTWRAACQRMRALYPEHYRNWIASLSFDSDDMQVLELKTSNQFVAHYVQTHLLGVVTEAVEATLGPRRSIRIVVT